MSGYLKGDVFKLLKNVVEEMGVEAYVIGGYVRDYFLERPCKDIDIVVIGDGVEVAKRIGAKINSKVAVYATYGTAMVRFRDVELEFVGARKESYSADSRNPTVSTGTLEDDQNRRDFTINALAFSLNKDNFGELLDPFGGMEDMELGTIRTPLEPDKTFSDDPLRMIRAIRFATQLGFRIADDTFESITRNADRIKIITNERINIELEKILASPVPSIGFKLFDKCGLLKHIFPEISALKGVETRNNRSHKDNFFHTLQVVDNLAKKSDNLDLRWAALMHDIAKPRTKAWDDNAGWTFHAHEVKGAKMVVNIFKNMKLPLNQRMKFIQKMVYLHLRPIALVEDVVSDSAVRRLLFEAGDDIDSLMLLCEADITSKNDNKVKKYLDNFALVRLKLKEIEAKDKIRNFQPPINGDMIMDYFSLPACSHIGEIKSKIKDAILDGDIENDYQQAFDLMIKVAAEYGIVKEGTDLQKVIDTIQQ